jgi:D-amino-acid dehydrogenase
MIVPSHFVPLAAPGMIRRGLKWMWNPESPFYIRPRLSAELLLWLWRFRRACSHGHVSAAAPLLRDLHMRSRQCYEKLEAELPGGFGLQQKGLLMLCRTAAAWDEEAETAEMAEQLGVPARVLDAAGTAALDPAIEMDVRGSVYYPSDCHLSPNQLMESMHRELCRGGCRFQWQTDTTGFVVRGDRIDAVTTTRGEIKADEVVLCGGVWSTEIARELRLSLPMQAGRGYSVTLAQPAERPEICSILTEARVAVTPIGSALRFAGTMEIAGLDESVSSSRVRGIVHSVPQYFPKFRVEDFSGVQPWVGLRPCSPDGLPYLGRTRRFSNALVSTGHAMMGISLALVSGQITAELLGGRQPSIDRLQLLSPDRYSR